MLALSVATDAITEQREALQQVRDRALAVAGAVTAAGALLLHGVEVSVGGAREVAGWLCLGAGVVGLLVVLHGAAQTLRPRTVEGNMAASTVLGWPRDVEPDAQMAMHLDGCRAKNVAMLEEVHRWFTRCLAAAVPTVALWAAASILWRT